MRSILYLHPFFSILSTKSPLTVFTPARVLNMSLSSGKRKITIDPSVFTPSFAKDGEKEAQWKGFIRKAKLTDAPEAFEEVVEAIEMFIHPLVVSYTQKSQFCRVWTAPGPWL